MLKVIAIIVLVFFALRFLMRIFLPMLGHYAVKKATENMQEHMKRQSQGERVYQSHNVEIRKGAAPGKQGKKQDGTDEYVEFEEV